MSSMNIIKNNELYAGNKYRSIGEHYSEQNKKNICNLKKQLLFPIRCKIEVDCVKRKETNLSDAGRSYYLAANVNNKRVKPTRNLVKKQHYLPYFL